MKVIDLLSRNGGVGRTTLAGRVAVRAQQAGQRTLLVDLDPWRSAAAGRTLRATLNATSLGQAQAAIREAGRDRVAVVMRGTLGAGDAVLEAGIVAQPKTPKPAGAAA